MKKISKLTSLILALALAAGIAGVTATAASAAIDPWPSLSEWAYAEGYALSASNVPVYTASSLATRGTAKPYEARSAVIYGNDLITIYKINSTFAYVSYPVGNDRRWGYIQTSALTPNNMVDYRASAKGKVTVYNRPGGAAWTSFNAGDYVIGFAASGSYTQCFFTSRSGYRSMRLGWVLTTDFNKYVRGTGTTTTPPAATCPPATKPIVPTKPSTAKGSDPIGYLDAAVGSDGTVTVTGWALDWDKTSAALDIHVYIGGAWGKGEGHGDGVANKYRPDVNTTLSGAGNYHGFSHTVRTAKRGQQTVYVYAANATGTPGVNKLIGQATVNIGAASYTVTYDANGGSGAPAAQNKSADQAIRLSGAIPANGGKIFKEWNTKKDGTGTAYKPGAEYKANASVTLYAQWSSALKGDLNGDGKINSADLWLLISLIK